MRGRPEVRLDAAGCIFAALCLLLLPLRWNVAFITAGVVHEASHLIAVAALGIPVTYFNVGIRGAEIGTGYLSPGQELFCAASGPLGSLCMLLFIHLFPELALCGLVQGLFNLLPLYPFDGGRILRCVLVRFDPIHRRKIESTIFALVVILLSASVVGLLLLFRRWWLCICGGYVLLLYRAFRKIPCKDGSCDVQ